MNITFIIRVISYAIGVLLLASFPVRTKRLKLEAGECLLPLKRSTSKMYIVAILLCFAVIFILRFRDFQLYITVIMDLACVLGINLAVRETVNRSASGVYENALVTEGDLFYRKNIIAIPEITNEKDDDDSTSESSYENTLKIVTQKAGETWIAFDTAEEKRAALLILKDWV
ncbi:MAG: hypothetical protein BKP49_02580 [Treponema sp. CETP13]|nr:MAG: hypothetical protein BKP49_02580 [Treponema sp. CETP13]